MSEPYDIRDEQDPQPRGERPRAADRPLGPPPPPPGGPQVVYAAPPGRSLWSRLLSILLVLSLLANLYLGAIVASSLSFSNVVTLEEGDPLHRIVVLPVEGVIDDTTYLHVRRMLRQIRENEPKAVILRVDSGGGTVGASDRIWAELVAFREDTGIPVVASFGSMAASGGYYISAMADYIFAEPTCITGSIGVMANVATFDRLLEKIGVTPEVLVATQSPEKDVANNLFRPWTDRDREKIRSILDHAHERFVSVVSDGRKDHLTVEEVASLATGEVYTTEQAVENKLVDAEGYLQDAIDKAVELAQFPEGTKPQVETYVEPQGLVSRLLTGSERPTVRTRDVDLSALDGRKLRRLATELTTPQLEYRFNLLQP